MIEVVGESEFVIVPLPETNDHVPTPTEGVFAFITVAGEEIQSVCEVPAFATVGISSTVIATVDVLGAHGAFEMVQAKTLFPKPNPVIEVVGESELVIVPLPETNVHTPVPTPGVLAFIVVVGDEMQSV